MGLLVEGQWQDRWYDTDSSGGRFERQEARFRNWVTADGRAGPTGVAGFKAEPDRYHLYVSYACPWAHRTLILRKIKNLEQLVPLSVVHWHMGAKGWTFAQADGVVADPIHHAECLFEIYTAADSNYTGRVTVPVLWDKHQQTIVSNESADIIRMFNSAFDGLGAADGSYYPEQLQTEIDRFNARVYRDVNNGVYRAGFATTQQAYEEAVNPLFEALDWLDERLATNRFLCGRQLTEADWRLFTTLFRFDPVYVGHFKCNLRRLVDYPNLWPYTRDLYQMPGIADTTRMNHIKSHYYTSHPGINPTGIVPIGPNIDYGEAQDRRRLGGDQGSTAAYPASR